jgi:NAD(P)H-hydrate epimerase
MIPCVSVENMRSSDAYTIANFVPSLELMYRAALGIYKAVSWKGSIAIVTGSGNNGGDGFALACILKEQGTDCTVFTVSERLSADSAYYAEQAAGRNVKRMKFSEDCLAGFDIVVDCLLGTGFQGKLREDYRAAIEAINASGAYVVSADINSGMNGDTGDADIAVCSDLTVTIGFVKKGLIAPNAEKYIRRLVCADIGIELEKEEFWISDGTEISDAAVLRSPAWLDRNVLRVY